MSALGDMLDETSIEDFVAEAKEANFFACYTASDTRGMAALLETIHAIDEYEVDDLFDEMRALLIANRTDDALLLLDRWRRPKFSTEAECKAAIEAAA